MNLIDTEKYTFANIGVYHPDLFQACRPGRFSLLDVYRSTIAADKLTGELFTGVWDNIGTPEELQALTQRISRSPMKM